METPTLTFTFKEDHWSYDLEAELNAGQALSLMAAMGDFLARFADELQDMVADHDHDEEP